MTKQGDAARVIQRFTTEYIEAEDRLRLSGELADGQTVVLWLTQRLIHRLVPHLCLWLERQLPPTPAIHSLQGAQQEFMQGLAQQAARAQLEQLTQEPPVRAQSPAARWRVDVVDVTSRSDTVTLTLKGEGEQAMLLLPVQGLRLWLGIVHEQCRRGSWPADVWPAWMETSAPVHERPGAVMLH